MLTVAIMDDHHVGDPFYAVPTTPQPTSSAAGQLPVTVPAPQPSTEQSADEPVESDEVAPTATPHEPVEPHYGVSRSDLYGMRLSKLQEAARRLGLDDSGKRPALIARIRSHTNTPPSS